MAESKSGEKRTFNITGMTCANCARNVERALNKVDGVSFAAVNLATQTAFVNLKKDIEQKDLERAVSRVGYGISYERVEDLDRKRYEAAKREVILAWIITLPLMVLMVLHMSGREIPGFAWMEIFGAGVVITVAGWRTFKSAWIAGLHAHTNMDTLVSAGSTASWVTTLLHILGLPIASFGTIGAMIVGLHVTGRFIESRLRDKASKAIKSLLHIQAREARVVSTEPTDSAPLDRAEQRRQEEKHAVTMPIEAVKEGFEVLVRPGERIPTDGEIVRGASAVDESMITGESIPVKKEIEDEVTGGSLNLTGSLRIRVTAVGKHTFLAQMIELIQEAQGAKIPIQALADRITKYFVPAIIVLAIVSGVSWYFLVEELGWFLSWAGGFLPWVIDARDPLTVGAFAFVTVIVIACPCALGLATPMALIAGTGRASRIGLIIRNAEAIQTAKDVGTVVMDKTGTLTEGDPKVVDHDLSPEDLAAVAAAEAQSNHPLARAVAAAGREAAEGDTERRAPDVESIEEVAGQGLHAVVDGTEYFIGRPDSSEPYTGQLTLARTVVEVKKRGDIIGFLAIEDPIREDTVAAIADLGRLGIRTVMATGDNEVTARAVAERANIAAEHVHASVRPEDKLSIIRDYQTEGSKVMMVGDGMNDAAALKGADIGVAVGSGTDLAIDNADIVIVKGGVSRIADAIRISRRTFSVIRQNLFWAFAYNVIAIPLAMSALLHPVIAEGAMALSSISVVLNSTRISASE
jgi:Cu+-exporting ATPase